MTSQASTEIEQLSKELDQLKNFDFHSPGVLAKGQYVDLMVERRWIVAKVLARDALTLIVRPDGFPEDKTFVE